jgi:hypothetical protein
MAAENPSWGEARLADELLLKLGILVSPRTVLKIFVTTSGSRARPGPRRTQDPDRQPFESTLRPASVRPAAGSGTTVRLCLEVGNKD